MEIIKTGVYYCSFVLLYILYQYGFALTPNKLLIAMLLTSFYFTYMSFRNNFISNLKGVFGLNLPYVVMMLGVGFWSNDYSNAIHYMILIPMASGFGVLFFKTKSILVLMTIIGLCVLVYFDLVKFF